MAKQKPSKKSRSKPKYQVLCHVTFDAIPDIIEGKKAFHINDFDKYLAELKRRVRK